MSAKGNTARLFTRCLFISMLTMLGVVACRHEAIPTRQADENNRFIALKWNKAYASETRQDAETGLQWCLSYLGARLPSATYQEAVQWQPDQTVNIHFEQLGFNETALTALSALIVQLKTSDEYRHTNAIDMGRFILLTINSSNHYYKITGSEKDYHSFASKYHFDSTKVAIIESSVSKGERLLRLASGNDISLWGFTAAEINGSLKSQAFQETEHEVLDIMPNGQLRFAIYDEQDKLVNAANVAHTNAGKPAKCLWCHEVVIQRSFHAVTSVPGYYPIDTFTGIIKQRMELLNLYRQALPSRLDFSKRQDHTKMELLYISFMEPSAMRLANEWGITENEVKTRLAGIPTHPHHEFAYLGELYHRKDIDSFSPFMGIRVPDDAREQSAYEPDLIPGP